MIFALKLINSSAVHCCLYDSNNFIILANVTENDEFMSLSYGYSCSQTNHPLFLCSLLHLFFLSMIQPMSDYKFATWVSFIYKS